MLRTAAAAVGARVASAGGARVLLVQELQGWCGLGPTYPEDLGFMMYPKGHEHAQRVSARASES